jgi:hypothetical protein
VPARKIFLLIRKSQIYKVLQIWIRALYVLFVMRKSMQLRTCRSFKSANHKKIGSTNRKFPNGHTWGFAICGTYLRTTYLCNLKNKLYTRGLQCFKLNGNKTENDRYRKSGIYDPQKNCLTNINMSFKRRRILCWFKFRWCWIRVSSKQTKNIFGSNRKEPKHNLFRLCFCLFHETKK